MKKLLTLILALYVICSINATTYSYNFKTSQQGWTINNVSLGGLSSVWQQTAQYGMKASAFVNNRNYATESWLMSPTMDLSGNTSAILQFNHARRYGSNEDLSVLITRDSGTTWDTLPIPYWPSGSNWTFINSGTVDISAYISSSTMIAFVYTSTTSRAATWEVSDVYINAYNGSRSISPNTIIYSAPYQLTEGAVGLHEDAFNVSIRSHTFANGIGTITFLGDVKSIGSSAFFRSSNLTSITIPDSVTSIGNSAFSGCSMLTSITLPDSMKSIGANAFKNCPSLTSVTIPKALTSIGDDAFDGCSGLTTAGPIGGDYSYVFGWTDSIPTKAFYNISSLTSVTIPNGVMNIGSSAFYGCSGLTSITLPDSMTSIGNSAFYGCSGLTSITLPDSLTSIGNSAFYGCSALTSITIPSGVKSIGYSVFHGCSGLTSITLPDSLTSIGYSVFYGCSALTSITIPSGVKSIGSYAFQDCSNLDTVTINSQEIMGGYYSYESNIGDIFNSHASTYIIGEGVTSIGSQAFDGCWELKAITFPSSLTSIHTRAFSGCSGLTSITIPENVTNIDFDAFWGCSRLTSVHITDLAAWCGITFGSSYANPLYYTQHLFVNGEELDTNLIIPNNVTNIGNYVFYGCSGLTSVTIPNSVTSIGKNAFEECSGLTSVTIPNSVTSIGKNAFEECSGLTSVHITDLAAWCGITFGSSYANPLYYAQHLFINGEELNTNLIIPHGVTSIGSYAFYNYSDLTSITIPNGVTSIGEGAFEGCSKLADITCYASNPPSAHQNSFANFNVFLHVPCDKLRTYQTDAVFGSFRYIQCIEAEETVVTTVTVTPAETEATFAWPTNAAANNYTLTITKEGVVFCTLTFNANGQLLNIAFAPGRDGAVHAPEAELTATGYQFTVTGLESGSTYAYTLDAKDADNNVVANYSGTFTATGGMGFDAVSGEMAPTKLILNGQILIQRGNRLYNLRGQEVK